jgi:cell division protein FtsN
MKKPGERSPGWGMSIVFLRQSSLFENSSKRFRTKFTERGKSMIWVLATLTDGVGTIIGALIAAVVAAVAIAVSAIVQVNVARKGIRQDQIRPSYVSMLTYAKSIVEWANWFDNKTSGHSQPNLPTALGDVLTAEQRSWSELMSSPEVWETYKFFEKQWNSFLKQIKMTDEYRAARRSQPVQPPSNEEGEATQLMASQDTLQQRLAELINSIDNRQVNLNLAHLQVEYSKLHAAMRRELGSGPLNPETESSAASSP